MACVSAGSPFEAWVDTHNMSTISGSWLAASASVSDSTILSSSLFSDALSMAKRNETSNTAVELSLRANGHAGQARNSSGFRKYCSLTECPTWTATKASSCSCFRAHGGSLPTESGDWLPLALQCTRPHKAEEQRRSLMTM